MPDNNRKCLTNFTCMKVFLSWSGAKSQKVASIFNEWLPSVIQSISPFMSIEDIEKGARWNSNVSKELEDCSFGILCVTKDNIAAPWLLFEAGALSKKIADSHVCPVLFDLQSSEIIDGPLSQFQLTRCEKEDIFRLIKSINAVCEKDGISEEHLSKTFDKWWPELKSEFENLQKENDDSSKGTPAKKTTAVMLEEIQELSRSTLKLLSDPSSLLPRDYFKSILSERMMDDDVDHYRRKRDIMTFEEMRINVDRLCRMITTCHDEGMIVNDEIVRLSNLVQERFEWLFMRLIKNRNRMLL